MDGFEMGTWGTDYLIQGATRPGNGYGLKIQPADPPTTSTRLGPWEMELVNLEDGQQQIIVSYEGRQVIRVTGPRGVTVDLLRQD
jgi:hypothetical protein